MVEREAFLANPKINIVYPNAKNMIVVPITKIMEIIMSIQVCFISWMTINYKENGEKKSFLANLKHQYRVSQCGEYNCSANNNKNRVIMSIQGCLN